VEAQEPQQPVTPGWKTSELWMTCGVQVSAFVVAMSTDDVVAKIATGLIAAMSVGWYVYSRYKLKVASLAPPAPDQE
jgi:hypothetical protein